MTSGLGIVPMTLPEANEFVRQHHRTHKPVPGCKFCIGVSDDAGVIHGVAIVGRPVARMLDNGWTLEVNRACTDGTKNANSMLYGACWRATKELGYRKLITYTLPEEGGSSLRAAGWKVHRRARRRFLVSPFSAKGRYAPASVKTRLGDDHRMTFCVGSASGGGLS